MKKTYKIDVDCANCANKMEEAAKKNGRRQGLRGKLHDPEDERGICRRQRPAAVMEQVRKNCKKVESDCEIFF